MTAPLELSRAQILAHRRRVGALEGRLPPGADTTRFTNAGYDCPGDDDLEHVLSAADLVEALDSTFRIVERCLDTWTVASLDEVLRRPEWDASWVHTRAAVIQRVFSHDIYHVADANAVLGAAGAAQVDLWD